MVDRIILGQRGSQQGLWVSKPGFDVSQSDLPADSFLINSDFEIAQIVQTGVINLSMSSFPSPQVTLPDLGYRPLVMFWSEYWLSVTCVYLSNTLISFQSSPGPNTYTTQPVYKTASSPAPSSAYIKYVVWSLPSL